MRSVVITGTSTGIGWGAAKVLIANSFRVFGSVRKRADADRSQPQRPAPKWAAPTPNRSAPNRPRPKSHNHCAEVLVAISGAVVFWLLSSTIDAMVA
jgi:NAD(P)-dependent dehydrogenase (short-subunit alcohol dehydrogenase family)